MNFLKQTFAFLTFSLAGNFAFTSETPIRLQCLWASYQNFKISADQKNIVLATGKELPYESRNPKAPINPEKLTSIDQMYHDQYPFGFSKDQPGKLAYPIPTKNDQLRCSRYQPLYFYLYGSSAATVERDLVPVRWIDGNVVYFNRRYGAARALRKVVYELYNLNVSHPEIKKYLRSPLGGTFEWRHIAHSKNMSMHAFGAAIDINTRYSNYWRWEVGSEGRPHYRNSISPFIAEVFENNGFVWGGKWYHYDTMHFEFRPELLMNHNSCREIFAKYRN